ncbi:MAG: sulfatase-like hydrolase/transferase, partial [Planctomycetes bacterium]|nr:sulfatase-like hydrolase/transferase [Planctomycetota bacterium]
NPVPVVFVVLDEFCSMSVVNEQREIDAERFPNLAKLAGGATWYRNSTSVFPDTWQALPSMLSGRYPTTAWAPTVADLPQNLFSVIEATGAYEWTAFEPVSRLAPRQPVRRTAEAPSVARQITSILPTLQKVLLFHIAPTELQKRLPEIPKLWFGLHEVSDVDPTQRRGVIRYGLGDDRQQQFNHFLHCLTDSEQPQLFFCHVLLPHIPWCYLPSGRKCLAETQAWELLSDDALIDELYAEQSQQRYLLQLQYTDLQVGRLLDRLHAVGLYDKCLLIVTADHGVSFKKNDLRRAVTDTNLADILPVPLFIKLPGQQQGEISDRNVESVDILPTVAHVLGIDLPLPVDGVSILGTPDQRTDKRYQTAQTLGFQPCHCPAEIARQSTVPEEIRQRFGPASDPAALFRIGPFPELIGKSSSDYARGEGPGATIRLRNGNAVYSSDPDAIVPCYLEGRVIEPAVVLEPVQLAVAVNGTIWATTRTYQADIYRDRFAVMLPETALREGANDIQWFVVTKTGTELRLHPCPTASD